MSWWTDSNRRPADYKSAALPTELHQHFFKRRKFNVFYISMQYVKLFFTIVDSTPKCDKFKGNYWRKSQ